jgi:flagellar P-ring protein FlgI
MLTCHVLPVITVWLWMKRLAVAILMGILLGSHVHSEATLLRLKDITHIKGVRQNQLVGYGLVVGLSKSGDKSRSTLNAQWNLLQNMGARIASENDIKGGNAAAVMVTAMVPPFAKPGDTIDVTVSSMADAKSLEGGVLINTQLQAPNGEVVAVAQGPVSTGGSSVEAGGSSKQTAIVTSGRIPGGAIIEREIVTSIGDGSGIQLVLDKTDFTLASRIAEKINQAVAPAYALDGTTIQVDIPETYQRNRVRFIAALENLEVESVLETAKVVVNERTGTIVIGNNVRLLPAAVAHGGITVTVNATNSVSQPSALSNGGVTTPVTNTQVDIEKKPGSVVQVGGGASLRDLVKALNAIGVTPSDLISILQALKAAGSLQATLEII